MSLITLEAAGAQLGACQFGPFNLQLAAGERVAILGPSGAGKSTLLRLLAGDLAACRGRVCLDGRNLAQWRVHELAQRRAVLPQSHHVAFGLQTDTIVALGRVARPHDPALLQIVREALHAARATHLAGRRFDTLSGGEQARVHLARVFAQLWDVECGLLLVDEPLAALDPGLQFGLQEAMEQFAAQRGHAMIAVLHDINHALSAFRRLWLIRDGRLQADLPADVRALPALESLYGVRLRYMQFADGSLGVSPARQGAQEGVAA
ncbi:ABC transporter ATP-binding protein [Uliginosibacterium sediminicola]|uniref:ATP-binding cassette domain-containing protein n=1 Tax=Uliginosibacterium sediminicola TaxID=2024550 RepID=A0ABU9Z3L5_9RHOO